MPLTPSRVIAFPQDLHIHRIVGKGQFGSVRMVSHKTTQTVYALKAMSKAPMTKKKTMEHVMGERTVMSETNDCPFCIRLIHAYQDARNVYLLMEWAPGGEMFNLLNALGAHSSNAPA